MATYLLTWNPARGDDGDFAELTRKLRRSNKPQPMDWRTGARKHMVPGETVFFLRQGLEPRGVFGLGRVQGNPRKGRHWAQANLQASYVDILIEDLIDPVSERILEVRQLKAQIPNGDWEPRASGQRLSSEVAASLRHLWDEFRGKKRRFHLPSDESAAFEGEKRLDYIAHRKRERALRVAKLLEFRQAHAGRLFCEVPGCGFDFGRTYGDIAAGYAHVHHLKPLRLARGPTLTRLADLKKWFAPIATRSSI